MTEADQVQLVIVGVPAAFLFLLILWAVLRKLRALRLRKRCLLCLADVNRPPAEQAQAIDGLAAYAGTDPASQAALERAMKDKNTIVQARARAVLSPSIRSSGGAAQERTQTLEIHHQPATAEFVPIVGRVLDHFNSFASTTTHYSPREDGGLEIQLGERRDRRPRNTPLRSPDGSKLARIVRLGWGRWRVQVDERSEEEYAAIDWASFVFSADGKRWAYAARRFNTEWSGAYRWVVVANGQESRAYESILSIAFSPDSKRLAYVVEEKGECYPVVDGKRYEGGEGAVHGVVFSPDSRHFAYWTTKAMFQPARLFIDDTSVRHGKAVLGLVGFAGPEEVYGVYVTQKDPSLVDFAMDLLHLLNQETVTRYSIGLLKASLPSH